MKTKTQRLVLSSLFLALAYIMPYLTGQIPEIGAMLCPMHIPVLLCGFICGWPWGLAVGFIAPLFRSLILGMPPLFPAAVCMAAELAAYGAFSGLFYMHFPKKKLYTYLSLIGAMMIGRLVWGTAMFCCMSITGKAFTLAAFLAGAFTNALPGIIAQIVLVPIIVMFTEKNKAGKS